MINRKILFGSLIGIAVGIILISAASQSNNNSLLDKITGNTQSTDDMVYFVSEIEGKEHKISIPKKDLLFNVMTNYSKNSISVHIWKKPEFADFYNKVGFADKSKDVVVVYPIFTQAAYNENGFYDYYAKKCDLRCLIIPIPEKIKPVYASNIGTMYVLSLLNYSMITDIDIDKNPDILKNYSKVIMLHNEYVTKKEFDAITKHQHVLYLYPNSLYAEVKTDYINNTLTLIRGHGYPDLSVRNGFDWEYDNSNLEYNVNCDNMTFQIIPNGKMLDCYPVYRALFDKSFLVAIKES